jgi:hypothetical protein
MKIGVVGSRKFYNAKFLSEKLNELRFFYGEFTVVSGGASGADTLAETWARVEGLPEPLIFPAAWDDLSHPDGLIRTKNGRKYDARAGHRRNQLIINEADILVAFMDEANPTSGTSDSIRRAREKGIPVFTFWPQ